TRQGRSFIHSNSLTRKEVKILKDLIASSQKAKFLDQASKATRADFKDSSNNNKSEQYKTPNNLATYHTSQTATNYSITINILKRLTAESLDVFRQYTAKSTGEERKYKLPQKQAKIASLKNLRTSAIVANKRKNNTILQALQAILRDKGAQFRSPQQEKAIRLATAKQSPLITMLPTGSRKSLIFIVPAILASAGVTIIVAPYTELKKQLVTHYINTGLDYKP
ncbi:hypothetical protein LB507_004186, partial [Fusarium sp. FIESC RH6]